MPERVQVGSDAVVYSPIFTNADETATDTTGTPTVVAVSRVTGDTMTAPAVTTLTAAGAYSCALTAAVHTVALDIIDLTWSGTVSTQTRTFTQTVEVVAGFYISVPELRAIPTLSDAATRPVAQLRKFRTEGEDVCDEARGTAYVRRAEVESFTLGCSTAGKRLRRRHPGNPLAVRVDGVDKTAADYQIDPDTRLLTPVTGGYLPAGVYEVAYPHGHTNPPQGIREAVAEYVRAKCHVDSSSQQRNVSSVTSLASGEVYSFVNADPRFSRWTGIPTIDDRINMVPDERVLIG